MFTTTTIIMKIWDKMCLKYLEREKIEILLHCRHVDDVRNYVRPLVLGWKLDVENFVSLKRLGLKMKMVMRGIRGEQLLRWSKPWIPW